ncbi:SDR family NAD(P)-dependent oxidoreductase [Rhizobium beringeri]
MRRSHRHAVSAAFDVTDAEASRTAIAYIEAEIGPIDILVNNAGMQFRTPLENFPVDKWDEIFKTNVSSLFYVSQPVAQAMIARGRGKIINIRLRQAELARPGIAPYTATKGAVKNPHARHGDRLGEIRPADQCDRARLFPHPLNQALVDDPKFSGWLETRTPAGRWGEVKGSLSAPPSSWPRMPPPFVNGHMLTVDGGITASL